MDKQAKPDATGTVGQMLRQAMALDRAGNAEQAVQIYKNILLKIPGHPYALYFLGINALRNGIAAEAVRLIQSAIEKRPDEPVFYEFLGRALQEQGALEEALIAFEHVLGSKPKHVNANIWKAQTLCALDRGAEAIDAFRLAINEDPSRIAAQFQLAETYQAQDRLEDAIVCLERLRSFRPDLPEVYIRLGLVKKASGDYDAAMALYARAHELNPGLESAYLHQAEIHLARDELSKAQEMYAALYEKTRGQPASRSNHKQVTASSPDKNDKPLVVTRFYLENLADHIEYLIGREKIDASFRTMAGQCRYVLDEISRQDNNDGFITLNSKQASRLANICIRSIHYADTPLMEAPVINAGIDEREVQDRYLEAEFPMVMIDDFLSPEALQALNDFCLESTIFFYSSTSNYLFSQVHEGFNCTLLYDIARGLKAKFPRVLKAKELTNMWAYRHPARGDGVRAHTDQAAVTFNFWITPDEANLDKEHGGLIIYDKVQPQDWDWSKINRLKDTRIVREQISDYLKESNTTTIAYRENRAMMFHSNLFHASDKFHFRDNYMSRRMNISLIFAEPCEAT